MTRTEPSNIPDVSPPPRRFLPALRVRPRHLASWFVGLAALAALVYFGGRQGWAYYHWREAQPALDRDDQAIAKGHLLSCVAIWPDDPETHFQLARVYRRLGEDQEAGGHLQTAARLGYAAEATAFEALLLEAQSGRGRGVEEVLLQHLRQLHPQHVMILEALVRGHFRAYRLEEAYALTAQWLERHPDDWQPYYWRGRLLELGRRHDLAAQMYAQAVALKPDHGPSRLFLGRALLMDRQYEQAIVEFSTCLQAQPDEPVALIGLAKGQYNLGQFQAARGTLQTLLAKHPDHAGGVHLLGKLALDEGKPVEAVEWLKKAETQSPAELDINHALARALRQLGRNAEADARERQLKGLREAIDRLEIVMVGLHKTPQDVALRSEAGVLLLRLDSKDEGVGWLKSALELDPNHAVTHQALADHYQKVGDRERAAFHRRSAGGPR